MKGGVMSEPNLFEEMLATYPAEKRELAREVYHRFADGDRAQFFTQLFLVLDIYAHYAERIPTRMISANADSLATLQEMREKIGLLAKTIETRDVNITNHAEKTDELCRITLAKCNETIASSRACESAETGQPRFINTATTSNYDLQPSGLLLNCK
jgi:hypothetical protein